MEASLEAFYQAVPQMRAMHNMVADEVDECLEVLKHTFVSNRFGSTFHLPSYDRWWRAQDERASYRYYADVIRLVGANDPAASVGTLMEIGRVLGSRKEKPKVTYRLVFFDGEEAFCEGWSECGDEQNPDNTYGSRHYVSQLRARNELENTRAMVLLDMMGYKNLELGRDPTSTRWLQDIVWQTGRALGYDKVFVDREEGVGGDDHEPFISAGVAAVDVIQLTSYPHWHRADDTIDKVSAQSMKVVGETILASLPKITEYVINNPQKAPNTKTIQE